MLLLIVSHQPDQFMLLLIESHQPAAFESEGSWPANL